jgi:hypothetical protein
MVCLLRIFQSTKVCFAQAARLTLNSSSKQPLAEDPRGAHPQLASECARVTNAGVHIMRTKMHDCGGQPASRPLLLNEPTTAQLSETHLQTLEFASGHLRR